MTRDRIMTVEQFVHSLGGTEAVACACGLGPTAVMNWVADDYIPRGHHLRLYLIAQDRGLNVSLTVFGLPEKPVWPKAKVDA